VVWRELVAVASGWSKDHLQIVAEADAQLRTEGLGSRASRRGHEDALRYYDASRCAMHLSELIQIGH
jgi:hypothetical protein